MWSLALQYYVKLNNIFNSYFGRNIENYQEDREMLKDVLFVENSNHELDYRNCDTTRTLEEMNAYDMICFSYLMKGSQCGDFVVFKYDSLAIWNTQEYVYNMEFMIYHKLLRYFRGIVIDIKNMQLVCTPFDKFANVGENGWEENSIENITKEFASAKIIEVSNKLDGSLQSVRFYNGAIAMSGSGSCDRENSYRLADSSAWINLAENENYVRMIKENPDDTHIFEWISKEDAHIVVYDASMKGLYLIGIRNSLTGYQYSYEETLERARKYNVKTTELYTYTLDEIFAQCKSFKASEKEGFVVNLDGHRVKIKCDEYVSIAKMLKSASSGNEIVRNVYYNNLDDTLAKLPQEYHKKITTIASYVKLYITTMEAKINEFYEKAPKDNRKDFMIWISKNAPKLFFSFLVDKYLGKDYNVIGKVFVSKSGNKTESILKFNQIEKNMIALGLPCFQTYEDSLLGEEENIDAWFDDAVAEMVRNGIPDFLSAPIM